MTRSQIALLCFFFFVFFAALLAFLMWPTREVGKGLDLQAQAHTGERIRLSELPGDVRLVYFGYLNCPDVCLDAALSIAGALKTLASNAPEVHKRVLNVFVTLDPANDVIAGTYNELEGYIDSRYGGQGIALRPRDRADALRMAQAFGIHFEYVEDAFFSLGYRVDHASLIFLTDRAGNILTFFPDRTPGQVIALEIQNYLSQR